ncbi:MAG: hydantoinase B/oxoprolinase family protein [Eubacteriales bacterium]
MKTNPISLEVFKNRLSSIAEEMGVTLNRTAYSPNIKERRDFSCALFDRSGNMIAQAAHIPVHLGSMPMSVEAAINSTDFAEGDMVILNDPFKGGTHLPDITIVAPVFTGESAPSFYVANRAHHADVGGISSGSMPLWSECPPPTFPNNPFSGYFGQGNHPRKNTYACKEIPCQPDFSFRMGFIFCYTEIKTRHMHVHTPCNR